MSKSPTKSVFNSSFSTFQDPSQLALYHDSATPGDIRKNIEKALTEYHSLSDEMTRNLHETSESLAELKEHTIDKCEEMRPLFTEEVSRLMEELRNELVIDSGEIQRVSKQQQSLSREFQLFTNQVSDLFLKLQNIETRLDFS